MKLSEVITALRNNYLRDVSRRCVDEHLRDQEDILTMSREMIERMLEEEKPKEPAPHK